MTPLCGPSTRGGLIPSNTSGPLARDPLLKLTGPRGRFFFACFSWTAGRGPPAVVWCRLRRFSCTWSFGCGPWCAGRRPWFGGAGVWLWTSKQGPPSASRGLWIEWPAAFVPGTYQNPRPVGRCASLWICGQCPRPAVDKPRPVGRGTPRQSRLIGPVAVGRSARPVGRRPRPRERGQVAGCSQIIQSKNRTMFHVEHFVLPKNFKKCLGTPIL